MRYPSHEELRTIPRNGVRLQCGENQRDYFSGNRTDWEDEIKWACFVVKMHILGRDPVFENEVEAACIILALKKKLEDEESKTTAV